MSGRAGPRARGRRGSVLLEALVAVFVLGTGSAASFVLLQRTLESLRTAEVRGPAAPLVLEVARGVGPAGAVPGDPAAADSLSRWGLLLVAESRGDSLRVEVGREGAGAAGVFVVPARGAGW